MERLSCVSHLIHPQFFPQDTIPPNAIISDSLPVSHDTLPKSDSIVISLPVSKDALDASVAYTARDSIIYDLEEKKVHLYGEAIAKYKNIELKADYIQYDWVIGTLSAEVNKDSLGNPIGFADFKEEDNLYKAKKLTYNFKTSKGKVYQVMTQEGEGYLHGEQVKRNEYNEWYGRKAKYTTCNLEHPHFYIKANRMKMVPDKVIVTGPANMVIEDVPLPIYIPFAIFPIKKGQRSGIILPEYGEEQNRGFFLRNGGYYFGISDYFDLALRGDLYSKGSWALKVNSNYRKRYKYNGILRLDYGRNRLGEPESPTFSRVNDFRVNWNHTQDSKQALNSRFSANVNFGTSTYDKNFSVDKERVLNSAFASKINYSKSWAGKPFNFSLQLAQDQNLNTGAINLQLPIIGFGVSRIQPFKSKKPGTQRKWYENIGFGYNFETQNIISGVDSVFFTKETFRNARYGMRHNLPISSTLKLFKFFTLTPRINYVERWYFQSVRKTWDPTFVNDENIAVGSVVSDTTFGFHPARDFNFGASLATKLFGQLNFKGKLKAIRHVFTPTLNVNYTPDFGTPFWGYYRDVQSDTAGTIETYSRFEAVSGIYGQPSRGKVGSIGVNLNNLLEMKVFSKKDTIKNEKKIKLLESLNLSSSYNIAADSLRLSPININGRTSFGGSGIFLDFRFLLDPYTVDSLTNRRINTFVVQESGRLTRLSTAQFSLTSSFQSKRTAGAPPPTPSTRSAFTDEELEMIERDRDLYFDFNIPWSINFSYNLAFVKGRPGEPDKLDVSRNSIDFGFDANITPKWKMNLNTGFDLSELDFVFTTFSVIRDLHCWVLRFDWVPYPIEFQRYSMQLNVKSHILQDLKLTRKKDRFDSVF